MCNHYQHVFRAHKDCCLARKIYCEGRIPRSITMQSKKVHEQARKPIPCGVSSPVRAIKPYPFYTMSAGGSVITHYHWNHEYKKDRLYALSSQKVTQCMPPTINLEIERRIAELRRKHPDYGMKRKKRVEETRDVECGRIKGTFGRRGFYVP